MGEQSVNKRNERLEEIGYNFNNEEMKIIVYNYANDIVVEFQDEPKGRKHTTYGNFKKGGVVNPYSRTIFNVGYIGEGKYDTKIKGKRTKAYTVWRGIMERGYSEEFKEKRPTYRDCYVCEEWHNFQNFAKWYEENYYECNGEKMCLDKDILIKGNKIYSPETCVFVPERINMLFTKSDAIRGDYPIGVQYRHKIVDGYEYDYLEVYCCITENKRKKGKYLGTFPLNRPFQAFYTYKIFKEKYIKQVADEYKNKIPQKLYDAMYKYEVEIND